MQPVSLQAGVGIRIQPRRGGVGAPPVRPQPPLSREMLYEQLQLARRRESVLQTELVALRTRRRQREARAIAATKSASSTSPAAARLHAELLELQRKRDIIVEKSRELQQTKRRVRPKDIHTLQRARALVQPKLGACDEENDRAESQVAEAQAAVDRLARQQREQLRRSQDARVDLARELVEERILKFELATDGGEPLAAWM